MTELRLRFVLSHISSAAADEMWGTRKSCWVESCGLRFVASHLSGKNKYAVKVGHPGFVARLLI
jgi:hypothetical protein